MLTKSGVPFKCRICKLRPCVGVNCPSTRNISVSSRNNRSRPNLVRDQAYPLTLRYSREYLQSMIDLRSTSIGEVRR